jgi:hypothetical protein
MHASTGINRYMHEFQNRPTAGTSDCPGCARRPGGRRRTREASSGWPSNGKALLGGMVAHDGGRQLAANVVKILAAIAQRRAVRLMMVGAHCHGAASWRPLPVHGSNVDEARNAEDRREVPGRVGRVWGGRPEAGLRPPFRVAPPREQPSLSFWLVPACRASDVRVRQGRAACYSRQAGCAGRQSGFHADH